MSTRLLFVHARSPLHAGTGQSAAAVDLPIARDRATNYPLLPGSSIKGTLRASARGGKSELKGDNWLRAFGPETANASDHAGDLAFSDARLLLLPVRSICGTFAWVTSPYLLACFARDARLAGLPRLPDLPEPPSHAARVTGDSMLPVSGGGKVILEEFDLTVERDDTWAQAIAPLVFPDDAAWQKLLVRRFCVVHDDTMAFLAEHGTEITTRVSIDPMTGTAKRGQLWTEEHLPAETVLVAVVENLRRNSEHFSEVSGLLAGPLQLGGKASVGRGRCSLHLLPKVG